VPTIQQRAHQSKARAVSGRIDHHTRSQETALPDGLDDELWDPTGLARQSQSPARSPEARKLLRRMDAAMSYGTLRALTFNYERDTTPALLHSEADEILLSARKRRPLLDAESSLQQ